MHNVLLTSQHRQYIPNLDYALVTRPITVNESLVFEEHLVQILDRRIKQLHIKQISLIKAHRTNYTSLEAT